MYYRISAQTFLTCSFLRLASPCPGWLFSCKDPSTHYTPLHSASLYGHYHICKILIDSDRLLTSARDKRGCVPLHLASWNGHFEVLKLLVESDADTVNAVNNAQESPLHLASQHGHDKVVRVLLEHHADPRLRNARFETPLDVAARTGHAIVCKILVGFCPDIALQSAVDCSSTGENGHIKAQVVYPLHAAARHSHIHCLQILRSGGFDLNFVTDEGSALHVAAVFGQVEAVKYLTNEGINPHVRDSKGRTALEVLREHEESRTSDLTYVIQSREGWSECRKIIDEYIQRLDSDHFNSSSDSGIDRRDSERSIADDDMNSDIWRPLPSNALDAERGIARFPITSPINKTRHKQSKRISDTLPLNFGGLRTTTYSRRGTILSSDPNTCLYRTPPVYDVWHQKFVQNDGITHTYNPAFPYDNIPRSVYDNAPAPGHSRWSHDCTLPIGKIRCTSTLDAHRQNQTEITSIAYPRKRPSTVNTFDCTYKIPEENVDYNEEAVITSRSREGSIVSNPSPQFNSRNASITTFSSSILTRSVSPINSLTINPIGRAPLAMPEELTGSTSTSILGSSVSPERESTAGDNSLCQNDRSSIEFSVSTLTINSSDAPPSPDSSRSKIFNTLCLNPGLCENFSPSEQFPASPETTVLECSGRTITSSCSLPMVSQISTTPPSDTSFYKLYHQNSEDESPPNGVKMRAGWEVSVRKPPSEEDINKGSESINEIEEWKKIDEILSSFGGAVCRESVFAANYESQVAVFLRDCRSQALTLQLTSQPSISRHSINTFSLSSSTFKSETNHITVSQWLRTTVGVLEPRATEIGQILTRAGFDSITQLYGCLTARDLSALGIEKSIQQQILTYLSSVKHVRPNANNFNYVSDWLNSLELTDYLGNFVAAGLKTMCTVKSTTLTRDQLEKMGITLPGHIARILQSLMDAKSEKNYEKKDDLKKNQQVYISSNSFMVNVPEENSSKSRPLYENINEDDNGDISKIDLLHEHASFSAHYLGSMEISNIDGTEESRRAMTKLKKSIRVIAKVPQVMMEISIRGVRILDGRTGLLAVEHEISQIQIVCQDERDLNCFTYISQDADKNLCHVFCVLTADVATEIIVTLGQAFELAYKLQNGLIREEIANV
ncbi:hypothetical protein DICVIV_12434 [Dictyocaulus viviparus]|uniref:Ankyrin repeat protein n=1 Tax=Dictyocaulus viviparus TaxID=29172 RepID=A0A0D8XAG1_DICVI|nr:hypothetical protein DICVIV_12434 [Dictyocaulus viviparus]